MEFFKDSTIHVYSRFGSKKTNIKNNMFFTISQPILNNFLITTKIFLNKMSLSRAPITSNQYCIIWFTRGI